MHKVFSKKIFKIYLTGIILLVTLPLNSAGKLNDITILYFRSDYLIHSIIFIPWMFFNYALKSNWFVWFVTGLIFAICSEFIQYILPYRAYNVNDLLSNSIGIIIGTVSERIYYIISN